MEQQKNNEIKETIKPTTNKWYYDRWMFRELDDLAGKRWTSYENNESEARTHSSEGRTQKGYVLCAWQVNVATGTVQMQRSATCKRI